MSEAVLTNISSVSIATPAAGVSSIFVDTDKRLKTKNDAGFVSQHCFCKWSLASQAPAAASRTYLTGSEIAIPPGKVQIGTRFRWTFDITKTAAGTAASTYDIAVGTLGTTGDTARVSFTKPAGTAAVDNGKVVIDALVRGPLSSAGIVVGHFTMTHNLAATGHATIPCVNVTTISAGFDITVANLIFGICLTSGAADAITLQMMLAEAWNV